MNRSGRWPVALHPHAERVTLVLLGAFVPLALVFGPRLLEGPDAAQTSVGPRALAAGTVVPDDQNLSSWMSVMLRRIHLESAKRAAKLEGAPRASAPSARQPTAAKTDPVSRTIALGLARAIRVPAIPAPKPAGQTRPVTSKSSRVAPTPKLTVLASISRVSASRQVAPKKVSGVTVPTKPARGPVPKTAVAKTAAAITSVGTAVAYQQDPSVSMPLPAFPTQGTETPQQTVSVPSEPPTVPSPPAARPEAPEFPSAPQPLMPPPVPRDPPTKPSPNPPSVSPPTPDQPKPDKPNPEISPKPPSVSPDDPEQPKSVDEPKPDKPKSEKPPKPSKPPQEK